MKNLFKFIINRFLNVFDLEIVSRDRQKISYSLDFDYREIFKSNQNLVIFDVGANKGQSVNRFRSIFLDCIIHCFEPDKNACGVLKSKYLSDKKIFINEFALSNNNLPKNFFIYYHSTDNSFNLKNDDTPEKEVVVECETLDAYINKKNISRVNILKIDTQSFNKEVIEGAKNSLKNKVFDVIEIELNFGDYYEYQNNFLEIENYLQNYRLAGINKSNSIINDKKYYTDVYYIKKI